MAESTPLTKSHAMACFSELSSAFRTLHHYSKDWTEDDIISVMDEVTSKCKSIAFNWNLIN